MIRLVLLIATLALPVHASEFESDYRNRLCGGEGWQMETRLANGTQVDCLTERLAIEVEFGPKWAEAIGQSLNYAAVTGKQPAVIMICKRGTERKCLNWALLTSETLSYWNIPFVVWQCSADDMRLEDCDRQDFGGVKP